MFTTSENAPSSPEMKFYSLSSTATQIGLGKEKPFINFDLELTEEEQRCLKKINISSMGHYENYGDLDILQDEVNNYISSLGIGNSEVSETISKLVKKLVEKIIKFTNQETAWVTMRAFTPISAFKEPRWHKDNYYYPPTGEQYKIAITLKGPGTLFLSKEKTKPTDKSTIISTQFGQGSIFVVGPDYAPIHSEPNIDCERLFLSMIPGSKEQIHALYRKTPEQEIISLLTNNGFYCYFVGPRIQGNFAASPYEDTEIIVFKLLDKADPQLLDTISFIIKSYNQKIKTEIPAQDTSMLRCTFPYGAVISVNDISSFFLQRKYKINSQDDIPIILKEFTTPTSATINHLQEKKTEISPSKFAFNTIAGRNTSGLFKPKPLITKKDDGSNKPRAKL